MKEALGLGDFDGESAVQDRIHAALAGEEHAEITKNLAKLLGAGRCRRDPWVSAVHRGMRARPAVVVPDDIHWG
jgi:hypothetical protein